MTVEMTVRDALNRALDEELARDPRVFLLGEDIADPFGGSWKVTKGLSDKHGIARVRNTPISESAIVGAAVGAALAGMRPVAEIMYIDFLALCADGIVNQAAKFRYMSGGQVSVPVVFRTQGGSGRSTAAQHGQSFESWFTHVPGLIVVMPSTPADAYGLLKSAIRDDNPVLFIESKMCYALKGPVPRAETAVPLGLADVKRQGRDVTIIAIGAMVAEALTAATELARDGIEAEVIDPRTLVPLDKARILESVSRTSRAVIVHEATKRSGWGAEMAALIAEEAFHNLDGPVVRVAGANTPIPASPMLEALHRPNAARIAAAVRRLFA
jgi:pyruvate/2-oxoglutarate/acetoin dehydrogenase E1 component